MPGTVYYQPLHHGMQNPTGCDSIIYVGTTYRVPRSEYNTIRQLEWEIPPDELIDDITFDDDCVLVPDRQGIIERFETLDRDTGDLLVMYRVPCRKRPM